MIGTYPYLIYISVFIILRNSRDHERILPIFTVPVKCNLSNNNVSQESLSHRHTNLNLL
jgi:hypothetical protein